MFWRRRPAACRSIFLHRLHKRPTYALTATIGARTVQGTSRISYAPYPWRTFTVVITADSLSLGFEYPTLVFLSSDLPGFVAAHETAHQWFYSLVGNDQARDPWLDEALAEWATARFGDSVAGEATTPIPAEVVDRLGESMSFWGMLPFRPFVWDGIYMQGVKALASFGDDERVDCALRAYVHANAYRVAAPHDLLDALKTHSSRTPSAF